MTRDDLNTLLVRIVSGQSTQRDVQRARELAHDDARLPEDLRADVFGDPDEHRSDAAALMSLLGTDPHGGLVAEAVMFEAGFDFADSVLAAIGAPSAPPVADAVRQQAGPEPELEMPDDGWATIAASLRQGLMDAAHGLDVSEEVLLSLGAEQPLPLAAAVQATAGKVDVAAQVMTSLGVESLPIAQAVRAQAGSVDVIASVMQQVQPVWLCGMLDGELDADEHRVAAHALMRSPDLGVHMTQLASIGPSLREALRHQAAELSLWADVATAIGIADPEEVPGWDGEAFATALRQAAGTIDIRDSVMQSITRDSRVVVPVVVPQAANESGWRTAVPAFALIAAAGLLFVMFGNSPTSKPSSALQPLQFASAGEITIEDLSYADNVIVHVMPAEGGAPLIVWVDEGVML